MNSYEMEMSDTVLPCSLQEQTALEMHRIRAVEHEYSTPLHFSLSQLTNRLKVLFGWVSVGGNSISQSLKPIPAN